MHGEVEVRAELVHLVDEADARDVVLVGLTPHGLGLGLDALLAVEHGDGTVEDAQRALHLDREVDVAGGVDDVDLVALPEGGHGGRRDRDAALLLLLHPVGRRRTVVGLTDLVVDTGVEEDALRRRRLAGVDVRHDADVADLVEVRQDVECHVRLSHLVSCWGAVLRGAGRRAAGPVCRVRARPAAYRPDRWSPAVVREGLVGLGHLVGVLAALDRGTEAVATRRGSRS